MMKKILIPLTGDDVAPRFDLAPEALIALVDEEGRIAEDRTIILDEASAETLCKLVLTEKIDIVVCCGIEDEYYKYLVWKKVQVFDSVMGTYQEAIKRVVDGDLQLTK
jgi:predicted Fe-Mo cluster-binding NifX family protein